MPDQPQVATAQQQIIPGHVKLSLNINGSIMSCRIPKNSLQVVANQLFDRMKIGNEVFGLNLESGMPFIVKTSDISGFWAEDCQ